MGRKGAGGLDIAVSAFAVCSLLLGGGTRQGLWSDALLQLLSLGLMAAVVVRSFQSTARLPVPVLLLVGAVVAVPLLQLIPLPLDVWSNLPGRAAFARVFEDVGASPGWMPASLSPAATWRAFLSLLPGLAVFFAVVHLEEPGRRVLSLAILAVALLSVLLGLAQVAGGAASKLRFYPITNPGSSVGLFANRNHHAAFLATAIPFAAAWLVGSIHDRRLRLWAVGALILALALLILGVGVTSSRGGILLAVVAALGSGLIALVHARQIKGRGVIIVAAAALLGAILIVQFAFFRLIGRLDEDVLSGLRFQIADVAAAAGATFQPLGSGLGTFVPIYKMFETPAGLIPNYINHAHNDWLELWVETGWIGIAVLAAFLAWFAIAAVRVWRRPADATSVLDSAIAEAGSLAVLLLLVHSALDYPLRTTALTVVFAFSCGLLLDPIRRDGSRSGSRHGRSSSSRAASGWHQRGWQGASNPGSPRGAPTWR